MGRITVCSLVFVALTNATHVGRVEAKPSRADEIGLEATVTEAQARFRRGLELYEEGDLDAARAEFRRAYDTSPQYRVLYNLARVELEMHDYPAALATFKKYLADGGDRVAPDRRAQVAAELRKLESRVAVIHVRVNVPDASVAIDDVPLGVTPLREPAVVGAGRRKIVAIREGYGSATQVLDVGGGDRPTVDLELHQVRAPSAPPFPRGDAPTAEGPRQPAQGDVHRAAVPWIGWAAAGSLAVGALVTAGLTVRAERDLRRARGILGVAPDDLHDGKHRVDQLALATDVLIGSALVAGGISLYLTFAPRSDTAPRTPHLAIGLRTVAVGGEF